MLPIRKKGRTTVLDMPLLGEDYFCLAIPINRFLMEQDGYQNTVSVEKNSPMRLMNGSTMKVAFGECKVLSLLEEFNQDGICLAGGAVVDMMTGTTPKDYDIYFNSEKQFKDFQIFLESKGLKKTDGDDFVPQYGDIQLIGYKFYEHPGYVIADFDLTCCQYALDANNYYAMKEIFSPYFNISPLYNRQIRHKLILRIAKYIKKGFIFSPEKADILFLISALEWEELLQSKGITVDEYKKEPYKFWQALYKEYFAPQQSTPTMVLTSSRQRVVSRADTDYVKMFIKEAGNVNLVEEVKDRIIEVLRQRYDFAPLDLLGITYKLKG